MSTTKESLECNSPTTETAESFDKRVLCINDFDIIVSTVHGASDRIERLHRYFRDAGIIRFMLDYEQKYTGRSPVRLYRDAAYGCGQHFCNIQEKFAKRNIIYFEDDAMICPDFCEVMNRHLADLPDDWRIFFAGHRANGYAGEHVTDLVLRSNKRCNNTGNFIGTQCVCLRGGEWRDMLTHDMRDHSFFHYHPKRGFDAVFPYWCKAKKIPFYFAAKSFIGQGGCESIILGGISKMAGLDYYREVDAANSRKKQDPHGTEGAVIQPLVTIVLPVYNVESYLRQCLDSIIHQTIQNIQIVCVNDGSTDGSLAILEEYAAEDSRFTILSQENQGAGSARNAAYLHIKGKYTFFADPDDWLEFDLCEKASRQLEKTDADVVYFQYYLEHADSSHTFSKEFDLRWPEIRISPASRSGLLTTRLQPWCKCWRTDFLIKNQIRFSEGKRPHNDQIHNWKGCVLARRVTVMNEYLYHHRRGRLGSYQSVICQDHFVILDTVKEIETILKDAGQYGDYQTAYWQGKTSSFHYVHSRLLDAEQSEFRRLVLDSLSKEDLHFIRSASLKKLHPSVPAFYEMLELL
jgi:glycosyltransferase involved in cell wall biosynthesis